jgi:hypothetical protein
MQSIIILSSSFSAVDSFVVPDDMDSDDAAVHKALASFGSLTCSQIATFSRYPRVGMSYRRNGTDAAHRRALVQTTSRPSASGQDFEA